MQPLNGGCRRERPLRDEPVLEQWAEAEPRGVVTVFQARCERGFEDRAPHKVSQVRWA